MDSPEQTLIPALHACRCGEQDCDYLAFGYPYCRPCAEHHRGDECPVDEHGRSLMSCGHPWFTCTTDDDSPTGCSLRAGGEHEPGSYPGSHHFVDRHADPYHCTYCGQLPFDVIHWTLG